MIAKLVIPNLPKKVFRRGAILGVLISHSTPYNLIEVFPARDGEHYDEVPPGPGLERLIDDAYADGIDFREHTERAVNGVDGALSPYFLAWHWTWARILKNIAVAAEDKYTMILIDDHYPLVDWITLNSMVQELCHNPHVEMPKIIQLMTWDNFRELPLHDKMDGHGEKWGTRIMRKPVITSCCWLHGIRGYGDAATIVNREGAKILYHKMIENPFASPEYHFMELAQLDNQGGFFSAREDLIQLLHIPPTLAGAGMSDDLRRLPKSRGGGE